MPRDAPTNALISTRLTGGIFLAVAALMPVTANAQQVTIDFGAQSGFTGQAFQIIALITVLALAPSILIMVTSFTRIIVVLSIVRTAMGTPTAPPNAVIISLALFLTGFIMTPTMEKAFQSGVQPYQNGEISMTEAFNLASVPFREFMESNVREEDYALFADLAEVDPTVETENIASFRILIPAFMISELRRAFEIGFLLFLPFVIIDLVVASVLMAMGMMMLPPAMISLPFKLIFFVLVDGWGLLAGSLVKSFAVGSG